MTIKRIVFQRLNLDLLPRGEYISGVPKDAPRSLYYFELGDLSMSFKFDELPSDIVSFIRGLFEIWNGLFLLGDHHSVQQADD